jgi:hypothetical protein
MAPSSLNTNKCAQTTYRISSFISLIKKCFPFAKYLIIIVMWVFSQQSIVSPGISVFPRNASVSVISVPVTHSRSVNFKRLQKPDGEVLEEFRLQL